MISPIVDLKGFIFDYFYCSLTHFQGKSSPDHASYLVYSKCNLPSFIVFVLDCWPEVFFLPLRRPFCLLSSCCCWRCCCGCRWFCLIFFGISSVERRFLIRKKNLSISLVVPRWHRPFSPPIRAFWLGAYFLCFFWVTAILNLPLKQCVMK